MLLNEHQQIHKQPELCVTCAIMQTKIRNCCTARYKCLSVTSLIVTTMNKSRLKIIRIFVCKCQYLSVTFAKNPNGHKHGRETQDQEDSANIYNCNMYNNTIKITLYCITTRKAAKGISNIVNAVDGQGLATNYDRQIQGQTNFRSTFFMLI